MLVNLKKLRREYNISQQKLAEAIEVTQPSINKYENHSIEPDIETLKRMADYFDTSIDYIVGYTNVRKKTTAGESVPLSRRERELLAGYQSLYENEKDCIDLLIQTLLERK